MAEISILTKGKPMLHYNGFVTISIPLTKIGIEGTNAMNRGESATSDVQLVRIRITLQSFKMGQEDISTTLVLKEK